MALLGVAVLAVGAAGCHGDDVQPLVDAVNECGAYNNGAKLVVDTSNDGTQDNGRYKVTCMNGEEKIVR